MISSFKVRIPSNTLYFISNSCFATKMQASSTQKTKDSAGRRLGVKKFGGHEVFPDDILIRQRGFRWHPGKNTYYGKDHTIHSRIEGKVEFQKDPWRKRKLLYVNVVPSQNPNRTARPPPPYCYHPELFPERALFNPEPSNIPDLIKQKKGKINKEKNQIMWFGTKANDFKPIQIKIPDDYLLQKDPKMIYLEAKNQKVEKKTKLEKKNEATI